jgi:hypothetical protein
VSVKLIGGLAALAIALTGCSAIGGAGSAPTWKPTYATSTVATSTVAPTAVRVTPPGIGVPVRNGSLEFTVHGIRHTTVVHDQFGGYVASAEGAEYVIVKVSVRNIDTQAVQFFPTLQSVSVDGQQFTAEAMPTAFLNHGTEVIQPGMTIPFELAFHLWTGIPPEAILLSDILGSSPSAARVELTTP